MKYIQGHLEKNLEKWMGKKWYHQRFDGAPYFIHFIAEAQIAFHTTRKAGGSFVVHYCFFENGKADWYIEMEDMKRVYTAVIKAGQGIIDWSREFMARWDEDELAFYRMCEEIGRTHLHNMDDKELMALHDRFVVTTLNRNSSSSVIDGFALGTDELVAKRVEEVFRSSPLAKTMRFTEVFSAVTAPVHTSFINEAEVSLLRIAATVKKDPTKREALLCEHQQKFFWIHNNYVDAYMLTVADFSEELDKILSVHKDPEADAKRIEELPEAHKRRKAELLKKLSFDAELLFLLKVSEDFTHWQDERKKATLWTMHYGTLLLAEIGKRKKLPTMLLKYMTPREMSDIFKSVPTESELLKRQKNSVAYWDEEGHEVVSGPSVEEVKKTLLGSTDLSAVTDFRGLTASLGRAVGKVKVVKSAKEIGKVEEGDILVAVMTRPDYVPAMKKAAAIVTDEGGVTCHAAIVSRELQKPCIIGTKIATKVLKDGDRVEVDANHGWVRRVNM